MHRLRVFSCYTRMCVMHTSIANCMKAAAALTLTLYLACARAEAFCFEAAAERYGVPAELLRAITRVESSFNPAAINDTHKASTGSVDLGLMQINSAHLPRLATWGITREALMSDACLNVMVGAWLLAQKLHRNGYDWNGIGSYNAGCTRLKGQACTDARNTYAWKVFKALRAEKASRLEALAAKGVEQAAPSDAAPAAAAARRPAIRSLELREDNVTALAAAPTSPSDAPQ